MAVLIVGLPAANPAATPLGAPFQVTQALRSTMTTEQATITYQLSAGHAVFFREGGSLTKFAVRHETVGAVKDFPHTLVLDMPAGAKPMSVQIDDTVVGASGSVVRQVIVETVL